MSSKKEKQLNPYSVDRLAAVPAPVKAIFIKWWFSGATFFFIGMGLPALHSLDNLDLVVALGIILGMVNDILVNNIFRYMRTDKNMYDPYMVFPKRSLLSFFLNIVYYTSVAFAVYFMYIGINKLSAAIGLCAAEDVFLPVEPVGYGIGVLMADGVVLGIKALVRNIINKRGE